jgi:DNA-binding MarR family transcriptional regulator
VRQAVKLDSPEPAAQLLRIVMLVSQSWSAAMRNSQRYVEPTQMASLMRIARGPCTMTDLAQHKAVSLSTISKSVDMLVKRGWVERQHDARDRRKALVVLTAAGRRALSGIKKQALRHVTEKLSPLTAAERRELMPLLSRLEAILAPADGNHVR